MKQTTIILLLLLPLLGFTQEYILVNEKVVLDFKTNSNKRLVISKDSTEKYLIYRYGTDSQIEFEYPNSKINSWEKFKLSQYLRGGGFQNEGLDLNYLYFTNGIFKYVVYEEYTARNERTDYGIKLINLKTNKITNIKADPKSIKGTLFSLRDNKKILEGDELFN